LFDLSNLALLLGGHNGFSVFGVGNSISRRTIAGPAEKCKKPKLNKIA
jgi:hypothetical protein